MAHATVRWQGERSVEQRRTTTASASASASAVLVLQTLHLAHREKVEAAIAELLVGINYLWRFEREMNNRALLLLQVQAVHLKFQHHNPSSVDNIDNNNNHHHHEKIKN
ncbi:hypothetical protein ACMD2_25015 [Ananas comosus]|nr:hypothetical protein ACMD2_25015 [Ananas comosus]